MTSARRQQQARDLTDRMQRLPPEQAGRVMTTFLVSSLARLGLQVGVAVLVLRALRRAWVVRGRGGREMVREAWTPAVLAIPVALAIGPLAHEWLVRRLLRRLPASSAE